MLLELESRHPVPISPVGGTTSLFVKSGDTVYYADTYPVSASSNQGSLTLGGGTVTFTAQVFVISASQSVLNVTFAPPSTAGGISQSTADGLYVHQDGTGLPGTVVLQAAADSAYVHQDGTGLPSTVISTATRSIGFWAPSTAFKRGTFILDHLAASNVNTPRYQLRWCAVDHTSPTKMTTSFPWGNDLVAGGVQWHILPVNGTFRGPFLNTLSGSIGVTSGSTLSTTVVTSTIALSAGTSQQVLCGEQVVLTSGSNTQVFIATQTVAASGGAVSIPVVPTVSNFAYAAGSTVSLGAWKGQAPQYTPGDIIINPDTYELIRALYSDAGNNGVWNAATMGPAGSAPRWANLGIHPIQSFFDPGTIIPATGKPDADNPGIGIHTLRTVVRAPRKKPLAIFRSLADFDVGGGTGTGASAATNHPDPPSPSGAVQLAFNSKWVKTLPANVDLSNQIVFSTVRVPGAGTTRTGISGAGGGAYLQLSSGGAAAFGTGNYVQYQFVAPLDSYLGEDIWDRVGCGPKDWVTVGTGATMTAINAIRLSLVSGVSTQTCGVFKIEMIDNNGQTASKGDGRAKQVLWFDDTSETNWLSSNSGISIGTLSSALTTAAAITSLPCAPTIALAVDQQIAVSSGSNVQMFTVTSATAAGAGPIPVSSETPTFAFPISSVVALPVSAVEWMEQFNFPGTIASAGAITNATATPSTLTPNQIRHLTEHHGWQFALHYYFARDGDDPQSLVQGVMDAFVQRAKHGLRSNPSRGDEDFAYHDVTHMTVDNRDVIKKNFRSARRYNSAETQIETLPPPNIYRHRSKGVATADINDWFASPAGTLSTVGPITTIALQVKAGQNLAITQPIQLVQGVNSQIFVVSSNTGYAATTVPVTSQTPNFAYSAAGSANIVSGLATLTGDLSTGGGAITSLPATPAYALIAGMAVTVSSGANSQTFIVSADAAAAAGSIPVQSQVPNFAYLTGSLIICPGSTLRGFVDQAIDMLGMAETVWDPSFTAGEALGFQNLMIYLDSQRANIDVVTFADAIHPWIKSA